MVPLPKSVQPTNTESINADNFWQGRVGGVDRLVVPLSGLLAGLQREIFIDNQLVRIHQIIVMIYVDRPRAMGV